MSISNLLVPNNYNLFINSVFVEDSFSASPAGAQTLSTVAATQILFPTINVSGLNYNPATSSYTVPSNGVYSLNANVEVQYVVAGAAANVSVTVSLLNGAVALQASTSTLPAVPVGGSGVTVQIPIMWYGFLLAGSVITISNSTPTLSAGSLSLFNTLEPGTIFYGKRGS
jgi:hypothetical protein